jgi:hypothetical protein
MWNEKAQNTLHPIREQGVFGMSGERKVIGYGHNVLLVCGKGKG